MLNRAEHNFVVKFGEISPDGVAIYDLNSRKFVYMNNFLLKMLGLSVPAEQIAGDDLLKIVHPEDLDYADHRYRELLSIGCMAPSELRVTAGNQTWRHLSLDVLWLEESYSFAVFAKDITALRNHEDYVVKISAQKDTLLDMLLHNLSGPLYLSRDVLALMKNKAGEKENEALLAMMKDTTSHCIGIIQQFLIGEHTESVGVMVNKSRFDALEKTRIILDLLSAMNKSKKFKLHTSLKDSYVESDPVKFCQIIHNILSNAVKYTAEDGLVEIEVQREEDALKIAVADDGVGVEEELKPFLFTQRVQGKCGLQGEPSTGLGLFLSRQLADLIGADLNYVPLDKGSKFTFSLPVFS